MGVNQPMNQQEGAPGTAEMEVPAWARPELLRLFRQHEGSLGFFLMLDSKKRRALQEGRMSAWRYRRLHLACLEAAIETRAYTTALWDYIAQIDPTVVAGRWTIDICRMVLTEIRHEDPPRGFPPGGMQIQLPPIFFGGPGAGPQGIE